MATKTKLVAVIENTAVGHAARKQSRKAGAVHKVRKLQAAADAAEVDASDDGTDEPAPRRGQWAAEKARAAEQGNCGSAAFRWQKLADVLTFAELNGESKVSFAEANKRADLARGERGEPGASWRLALQRTRQVGFAIEGWQVDSDAQALVLRK